MNGVQTYNLFKIFSTALFIFGGLLMLLCPKYVVKKEYRDDEEMLAKAKRIGVVMIVCGIVTMAIQLDVL